MYPEDCLQSLVHPDEWWVKNEDKIICRGALIFAFAPHVDQTPYAFEPIGRKSPTEHDQALVMVTPLRVNSPLKKAELPVAAMGLHDNEVFAAYRAKKRPCIVFSSDCPGVDRALTLGKPNSSTAPTFLAAPFYGVRSGAKRAGYSDAFVERVRHCEYPQFHWDILPIPGGEESILRLDHLQPFGIHHESYGLSNYMLSSSAMEVLDELIMWMIWGGVEENSYLKMYRQLIEETFPLG